jgi:hypothetical protein
MKVRDAVTSNPTIVPEVTLRATSTMEGASRQRVRRELRDYAFQQVNSNKNLFPLSRSERRALAKTIAKAPF